MKKRDVATLHILRRKKHESLSNYVIRAVRAAHASGRDVIFRYENETYIFLPLNNADSELSKLDMALFSLITEEKNLCENANRLMQKADKLKERIAVIGTMVEQVYPDHAFLFRHELESEKTAR